jgi:pimeloyl-ACP methyl ester carboxylesterase
MSETAPAKLARDAQQWIFDWMINETGKVFHFQGEERGALPKSVHTHAMISKALGKRGASLAHVASEEAAAGHDLTAMELYFEAATAYGRAQHVIFTTNAEKRYLHAQSLACFDRVRALAPYSIERVSVVVDGAEFTGNLHVRPGPGPAPLVFYVTGCDLTKEMYPQPLANHAHQRGMHIFSFDGPGQGESNLRGTALGIDNYERAASAMLDVLIERPEIDETRVAVYGQGFGSYWAVRMAAADDRYAAVVGTGASICDPRYLFERDSPRFKQLFAYLTQAPDEATLDAFIARMGVESLLPQISCPTLIVSGEYDPRNELDELQRLVASITGPAELWVFADQHHQTVYPGSRDTPLWDSASHRMAVDWIADRWRDAAPSLDGLTLRYIDTKSGGPYGTTWRSEIRWFDPAEAGDRETT